MSGTGRVLLCQVRDESCFVRYGKSPALSGTGRVLLCQVQDESCLVRYETNTALSGTGRILPCHVRDESCHVRFATCTDLKLLLSADQSEPSTQYFPVFLGLQQQPWITPLLRNPAKKCNFHLFKFY